MDDLSLEPGPRKRPGSRGLAERSRYAPWLRGPLTQQHLLINGRPLLDRVAEVHPDLATDVVSVLDDAWPESQILLIRQLTGRARRDLDYDRLEQGRLPLYGCPECLDIQCGALTAHVERSADDATVRWSDLRWEDTYTHHEEVADLSSVGPFTFTATQYDSVLSARLPGLHAVLEQEHQGHAQWSAEHALAVRLRRALGLDDSRAQERVRQRVRGRARCLECGHQWHEHAAADGGCSECLYEIEHGDPAAPRTACTLNGPPPG